MKLLILASEFLDPFQVKVVESLFHSYTVQIVGACIDTRKLSPLQKLRRELRKGRGGYIVIMVIKKLIAILKKEPTISAHEYFLQKKVQTYLTRDLYSPKTIGFIKSKNPDCIFRSGFGMIREPILSLCPQGVLSYHHGNIRKYRGMPAAFWELYHNESMMGATVQILTNELDGGKIVREIEIPIYPTDTWKRLRQRMYEQSAPLLQEACLLLDRNQLMPELIPNGKLGKLYTTPNFRQWVLFQIRIFLRRLRKPL